MAHGPSPVGRTHGRHATDPHDERPLVSACERAHRAPGRHLVAGRDAAKAAIGRDRGDVAVPDSIRVPGVTLLTRVWGPTHPPSGPGHRGWVAPYHPRHATPTSTERPRSRRGARWALSGLDRSVAATVPARRRTRRRRRCSLGCP